jgi:exopolysaccharide biosynthesis polyprenyl glycosylphosphotransferase
MLSSSLQTLSLRSPVVPLRAIFGAAKVTDGTDARVHAATRRYRSVLQTDLFRDALVRERKRADRFDQPFLLVLVSVRLVGQPERIAASALITDAMLAVKRDADILGWLTAGTVLGMIVPEFDASNEAAAAALRDAVRRELAQRLNAAVLSQLLVRFRIDSGSDAMHRQRGLRTSSLTTRSRIQKTRTLARDATKRALDVTGSLALLLVTAPVLLAIAAAVKLTSSGPVLFRQYRVGQTGEPFTMLKFRTMHADADKAIHQAYVTQFIETTGVAGNADAFFKIVNDPRVTRVGHFLRKTSLDELPQFWNVLKGDMSLVGPRPPIPYEVERYKRWHHRRVLDAKPGVTGLWQVNGRSRTTFDEMVRLDLRYARTRSMWTDIRILLATPKAVISGKGAC